MDTKTDRRIRKTKQAIHTAFLQLMAEKKLSQITVKELTEKADVNRKTFYNHYNDIYSVLGELEDECVDRILSLFDERSFDAYIEEPDLFFRQMISEISDNQEFYMLLSQSASHSRILNKLIQKEKILFRRLLKVDHLDDVWVNYFLNYASAGTISVINAWFEKKQDIPIDSLARFFGSLFSSDDLQRLISYAKAGDA